MKIAIKVLVIAVLAALVAMTAIGCKEQSTSVSKEPSNNAKSTAEKTDASKSEETGKQATTETTVQAPTKAMVILYFSDEQAEKLVGETREVENTSGVIKVSMEELVKGPKTTGLYRTIPATTKVLGVDIKGDIAYVNFSQEFIKDNPGGSTSGQMAISSVVDTLTEFKNVKKVQIMVDGKPASDLAGIDISEPVVRDESIIKK